MMKGKANGIQIKTDEKTKGQYSIYKTPNSKLHPARRQAGNFEQGM